jgi:WD40 repeat protein
LTVVSQLEVPHIQDADWSADGTKLAIAARTGLYLFDVLSGQQLWFVNSEDIIFSVSFRPDGLVVASAGFTDGFQLRDVGSGDLMGSLVRGSGLHGGSEIQFGPDGHTIATAATYPLGHEGPWTDLELWSADSGRSLGALESKEGVLGNLAFSPDGRLLATGLWEHEVAVWDVASQTQLRALPGQVSAFSPGGELLAVAELDRLSLLDSADYRPLTTLNTETGFIRSLSFNPDGSRLAVSGEGVNILDINTGDLLHRMPDTSGFGGTYVAYSPDGRFISTHNLEGEVVLVWGLLP